MMFDNLSKASSCSMPDFPGTVEQVTHQNLTQVLEWPVLRLKEKQNSEPSKSSSTSVISESEIVS